MRIRAPPGREESMERTKDFYNGMNYAKKQLQQREHERRRRKRYFKYRYIKLTAAIIFTAIFNAFCTSFGFGYYHDFSIFHADSIITYL